MRDHRAGDAVRYGPPLSAILQDENCVDEEADQRQVQQELVRRSDLFHPPTRVPAASPAHVRARQATPRRAKLDDYAEP